MSTMKEIEQAKDGINKLIDECFDENIEGAPILNDFYDRIGLERNGFGDSMIFDQSNTFEVVYSYYEPVYGASCPAINYEI